jgi:AraC-like DNA-binding protein
MSTFNVKSLALQKIVNLGQNIGFTMSKIVQNGQSVNNRVEDAVDRPPASGEITFRVGPLVNLASVMCSLGCEPGPIFSEAGFDLEEFQDPDHRLSFVGCSRLLASCVKATGCDHLGLLIGQRAEPSHLGIAGFLLRAASSVELALQALVENLDLHDEGGTATLDIGPEYTSLGYTVQIPGVSAVGQIYDLAATNIYQIMQALCGTNWIAASVKLQRRQPEDVTLYRRFFRSALYFNSTDCSITFDSKYLQQKPPAADALLYKHLEQEAKELHGLQHHELIGELPAALSRGLLTEQFAAHHIADGFGIHVRTLHRRLRAAGTSFRQELDQTRKSVSEQLLGSTSLPVWDIVKALGYSDSSGFIRAFQRWYGVSPSVWRKKNNPLLRKSA